MSARYVLIAKFTAETGYTDKAVRRKIEEGVWIEGQQYRIAPDGNVVLDTEAITPRDLRDAPERNLPGVVEGQPMVTCGVYMLLVADAVTYVGRSTSLRARLRTHRASGRQFDEARVIPCDEATSVWLEKELIRTLQPAENLIRYQRHRRVAERALARGGVH